MPSITFDNFAGGLDVRRGASVSDANRLRVLNNGYVTTGRTLQKRPCLLKVATLEAGTVGLKAGLGKLNTFYAQGAIAHANALFVANKVAHPTLAVDASKAHFGEVFNGFIYAAIEYTNGDVKHHYLDGTVPTHIADANCPNTKEVLKQQSKIYAKGTEVVRYCATNAPRNWTLVSDAGFLPTGLQALGSTTCTGLGQFGKTKLAVFFVDGTQVWNVDPNPLLNTLNSIVPNIGTRYAKSPLGFSMDVFFLADAGFRSITTAQFTDNLQDIDVGNPIDSLVTAGLIATSDPQSLFYSGLGQFWSIDRTTVWVYSYSRTAKLAAWSQFTLPVSVDASAVLAGNLYVRSGDVVYLLDRSTFTDDGAVPTITIEFPYLDFKTPGILKQLIGADAVGVGTANLALRFDPRDQSLITTGLPLLLTDTRPGPMTPLEMCAVSAAPVITHAAAENFRLDALTFYYENLGPV